jgi:hypothetical protein
VATVSTDPTRVGRLAKGLLEAGDAASVPEAEEILAGYRLQLHVGAEAAACEEWQAAALSVVNAGVRAMHGGVDVVLEADPLCRAAWGRGGALSAALVSFGGKIVGALDPGVPTLVVGAPRATPPGSPLIHLHASGWRAGAGFDPAAPAGPPPNVLATVTAAGLGVSEAFLHLRGDAVAGERDLGISLWRPGAAWRETDPEEPPISLLPAGAWLLGLGHLGQAYAWLLGLLPWADPGEATFHLQDTDAIEEGNRDSALLYLGDEEGERKTRLLARRLERLGLRTSIVERRLDRAQRIVDGEPTLALAGFDNVIARRALSEVGFRLIVDAGLGADEQSFCEMQVNELWGARRSDQVWTAADAGAGPMAEVFDRLGEESGDRCGYTQLAGRSVASSFVGLVAAGFVVAAVLRRLNHGLTGSGPGPAYELIDYSLRAPARGSYLEESGTGAPPRIAATKARR